MTDQLEAAWKAASKPFHHETVFSEDLVPIDALQPFLKSVAGHMKLYYPNSSFFTFDDWHAHDGILLPAAPIPFAEFERHLESTDSLYKWRSGDFQVHRALYPETLDFLLRVHVLDEDEDQDKYPGIWGSMSFTGYGFDLAEIRKRGHGVEALRLQQANSKSYFDGIYAG